ncbi:hypothetical protein D3C77_485570 [compost metagenome]
MVNTSVASKLTHGFTPGRSFPVVDQMISAHGLETLKLLITGRGSDHRSAGQLGNLQGEDRHATRALNQHGIARFERIIGHQRPPGSDAGGAQGRRLGMAVTLGGMGKGRGAGGDLLASIAIDAITRHRGKAFHLRLAIQPVWEEGADYRITHGELSDARPHRSHHAGAVGHGNARFAWPPDATDDGKVVIVEGVGVQTNGNLPRFRRRRFVRADLNLVVTAARLNINGLAGHEPLLN